MPWTIVVSALDVNGRTQTGGELTLEVWTGSGNVQKLPPVKLTSGSHSYSDPTDLTTIVCTVRQAHFADTILLLVRDANDASWRWSSDRHRVVTGNGTVSITLVLSRVAPPVLRYVDDAVLKEKARRVKQPADERLRKNKKAPPDRMPLENFDGVLTLKDRSFYRRDPRGLIAKFHRVSPAILAKDTTAAGWDRFAHEVVPVNSRTEGQFVLLRYGDLGSLDTRGPRFLVGVWMPNAILREGVKTLDFIVWFHPSTGSPTAYPQDTYPYRGEYPHALWASGSSAPDYDSYQPYVALPMGHAFGQHFLLYQMMAAKRNAVLVIPSLPSGDFSALNTKPTLMRFVKELAAALPLVSHDKPRAHGSRPTVRRIAVAAFSSSVPQLQLLMSANTPAQRYSDPAWTSPHTEFDKALGEVWSIDGHWDIPPAQGRVAFLNLLAGWAGGRSDRRFCFYNSDTQGRWDPFATPESPGFFSKLIAGAKPVYAAKGGPWAMTCKGANFHLASFSNAFMQAAVAPAGQERIPVIEPNKPHEMMPRLCFGHAAVTSSLATF